MQYGSTDAVLHKDLGININAHTAYPNVCYDIVYRHFLMLFFTRIPTPVMEVIRLHFSLKFRNEL